MNTCKASIHALWLYPKYSISISPFTVDTVSGTCASCLDVSEALEYFDDAQQQNAARQAAEKLYRKYSSLPRRETRAKLSQALARRGFSWDAIQEAVDALISDDYFD